VLVQVEWFIWGFVVAHVISMMIGYISNVTCWGLFVKFFLLL
jgi:hypothetical protein